MKIPPGSAMLSRAGGDVDPLTQNIITLNQNIAEMDAYAQPQPPIV